MAYVSDNTCMNCGKRISEDFDQCEECYGEEKALEDTRTLEEQLLQ